MSTLPPDVATTPAPVMHLGASQLDILGQHAESLMSEDPATRRVKNPRWTQEEDNHLRQSVQELGNSWQAIADRLGTGRTPTGVEQHWQVRSKA